MFLYGETMSKNDESMSYLMLNNGRHKISEGSAKLISYLSRKGKIKTQGLSKNEISNLNKLEILGAVTFSDITHEFSINPGVTLKEDL